MSGRSVVLLGLTVALGAWPLCAQPPVFVLDGGIQFPDGSVQMSAAGAYEKVIVVAKSGGQFTSIQQAIDSATGTPTSRYLVYVAPGTYSEKVEMKAGVDIQGAGILLTKITASGAAAADTGTVLGANDAELRFLTVECTGGPGLHTVAIYNDGSSPRITQVSAIALGGAHTYGILNKSASPALTHVFAAGSLASSNNYGIRNEDGSSPAMNQVVVAWPAFTASNTGIFNDNGSNPAMNNVDVAIFGFGGSSIHGIENRDSSPTLKNVSVVASSASSADRALYNHSSAMSTEPCDPLLMNVRLRGVQDAAVGGSHYGVVNDTSCSPRIHHSIVEGTTTAITGGTPKVAYSQIIGAASVPAGSCIGAYNSSFAALNNSCS